MQPLETRLLPKKKEKLLKIRKVKAAEAEAESKRLQGQGIADQRNAIIKGFEESISAFGANTDIDQKEIMNFVILTQYYDTMREMAKDNPNVIFMPHSTRWSRVHQPNDGR